jgi:hypothetical protein
MSDPACATCVALQAALTVAHDAMQSWFSSEYLAHRHSKTVAAALALPCPHLRAEREAEARIVTALAKVHWRNGGFENDQAAVVELALWAVRGEMTQFDIDCYDLGRLREAARMLGVAVAAPLETENADG